MALSPQEVQLIARLRHEATKDLQEEPSMWVEKAVILRLCSIIREHATPPANRLVEDFHWKLELARAAGKCETPEQERAVARSIMDHLLAMAVKG